MHSKRCRHPRMQPCYQKKTGRMNLRPTVEIEVGMPDSKCQGVEIMYDFCCLHFHTRWINNVVCSLGYSTCWQLNLHSPTLSLGLSGLLLPTLNGLLPWQLHWKNDSSATLRFPKFFLGSINTFVCLSPVQYWKRYTLSESGRPVYKYLNLFRMQSCLKMPL